MKSIGILIVDDQEELRDIIQMILEAEIQGEFYHAANGLEAIEVLKKNEQKIQLVLSDNRMPKMSGLELSQINDREFKLPFVLISGEDLKTSQPNHLFFQSDKNFFLEKPFKENDLLSTVKKIQSGIDSLPPSHGRSEEYISIKLQYLVKYYMHAKDVYLLIGKDKFVKISEEHPELTDSKELLDHYAQKNIQTVYLKKDQFKFFICDLQNHFKSLTNLNDKVQLAESIFNFSIDALKKINIHQTDINHYTDILEQTIIELMKDKSISREFISLSKKSDDYKAHIILTCILAAKIIENTSLMFKPTLKTITLASLLHDKDLSESDFKQELFPNQNQMIRKYFDHPIVASKFFENDQTPFREVERIILEHHEKPDGSGFPHKLKASQMAPMSALFILSHDMAIHCLYEAQLNQNPLESFFDKHLDNEHYKTGNFGKYFNLALELFKNN